MLKGAYERSDVAGGGIGNLLFTIRELVKGCSNPSVKGKIVTCEFSHCWRFCEMMNRVQ